MRANQRAHVNEYSLIGCLLHALYETSNFINSAKIFPSGSRALREAGLRVTRAIPLPQGAWPAESVCLGTGGGECARLGGLLWHRIPAGAARGVSPLLFFVGPLQSGLQAGVLSLARPDRYLPTGLMRQGVGSTGAPRQSDSCAAPLLYPHSPGNRGGKVVLGWKARPGAGGTLVLGCGPNGGGGSSPGQRPAPQPLLVPTPTTITCSPRLSPPDSPPSPHPILRLPPTLFVCLLSGSKVPPSFLLSLWVSLSISTSSFSFLSLPVSVSRFLCPSVSA